MTLQLLPNETVTRRRITNPGQYVDGFHVDETTADKSIIGNFQNMSGYERLQLPEGDRDTEMAWFYTAEQDVLPDDIIVRNSVLYEARRVEDWKQQNLQHNRILLARKDA